MKKVNVLIVLAGLFITGVMIYLMMAGVKTRQRKMVSWSSVATPQEAGQKIGKFFFPILKKKKHITIEIGDGFPEKFYLGFKEQAKKISPKTQVDLSMEDGGPDDFLLLMRKPDQEACESECKKGVYQGCVCLGAIKKLNKKERDPNQYWVYMARLGQNLAVLFYKEPVAPTDPN